MTNGELEVIRNVISRLKAGRDGKTPRSSNEVTAALNETSVRVWLDTWVIGSLECLLPETRNVELGRSLSK